MDYDFKNDWMLLKAKRTFPEEIVSFMEDIFQIMEIRERVGAVKGIKFEVRSREQNHNRPYIHAAYDKYTVSIDIETGEILAGNLPKSQQNKAVKWVKENREYLFVKWSNIAINATSIMTKSRLG